MTKHWSLVIAAAGILVTATTADANKKTVAPKKPRKGFYKILVKPKAKWVLRKETDDATERKKASITVETYDVRKVGDADVARIRWTYQYEGEKPTSIADGTDLPQQVAVTDKGMWLFSTIADDAKIAETLASKKPSRSDPPKAYKGTHQNQGRYLEIRPNGHVCMGSGPLPGALECDDVCFAEYCLDAIEGVVELGGTWAPNYETFSK